ncbi:MAG: FAD-dependent oxidoreductase [Patescibacteria group bacterium]
MDYLIPLTARREIAEGTMEFTFDTGNIDYQFKAGQHTDFTLIDPPYTDAEGNIRTFSFVNKPGEKKLVIATRMRDKAFKNSLKEVPFGTKVQIKEPMGRFTLHNDVSKPAVFLIGGIGITPVMSILGQWQTTNEKRDVLLFYANKNQVTTAYYEELATMAKANPNFHFILALTDQVPTDWQGETGRINEAMVRKYLTDPAQAIFYASGPAVMVSAMVKLAESLGVPEEQIKTEDFDGY